MTQALIRKLFLNEFAKEVGMKRQWEPWVIPLMVGLELEKLNVGKLLLKALFKNNTSCREGQ